MKIDAPPRYQVPRVPSGFASSKDLMAWSWTALPHLEPFTLADNSGPARQQTRVRLGFDENALYAHFTCQDDDIQGTYTQRDDPIYDEEVVEVFLAPGEADPVHYLEFEISPNAVLFDARISNLRATGGAELGVDTAWNPDIRWTAKRHDEADVWRAALVLPWRVVHPVGTPPSVWRANFYRIERSRRSGSEFSCWSPVITDPPDFHRPGRFGLLEFTD